MLSCMLRPAARPGSRSNFSDIKHRDMVARKIGKEGDPGHEKHAGIAAVCVGGACAPDRTRARAGQRAALALCGFPKKKI